MNKDLRESYQSLTNLENKVARLEHKLKRIKSKAVVTRKQCESELKVFLKTLPVQEAEKWAANFYWESRSLSYYLSKAFHSVFNCSFRLNKVELELVCPCGNPIVVKCEKWTDLEYKRNQQKSKSRFAQKELCKDCEDREDKEWTRIDKLIKAEKEKEEKALQILKTMPYSSYLQTDHWQRIRKKALNRADYKCQLCNKGNTILDVHHRTYENRGEEHWTDVIVLCRKCHEKHHGKESK